MSLRRNIIASYASQLYLVLAGITMVPSYIAYMGAEAYGLVGFFSMLQVCFNLLDLGLSMTVARETARFRGGAVDVQSFRGLIRALERIFLGVALLGGALLFFCAETIATRWLRLSELHVHEVIAALQLMAVAVALRWMAGLYRGVISGSERLVWLSGFNAGIATLRFMCVLPVLMFVSATPMAFFSFQLGVAVVELFGLAIYAYRLLPSVGMQRIAWGGDSLKPSLKFSLSIGVTSSIWILVTQTDKLLLSNILSLADYGYFTAAVLAASGIALVAGPISSAIMPRMVRLQAEGREDELVKLYCRATQLIAAVAGPLMLILACFPAQVLWAWTGDSNLQQKVAPVLTLYAIGYGIMAVGAFPYYLQYAKGNLKLHLIGNLLLLCTLIPSAIWAATHYGAVGAGWAWLVCNVAYLVLWTPLVHRRFVPGLHVTWLFNKVVRTVAIAVLCGLLGTRWLSWADNRVLLTIELLVVGACLLLLCLASAGSIKWPTDRLRRHAE